MSEKKHQGTTAPTYRHEHESVLRPDIGIEAQFRGRKEPRVYRFDSSLAPELSWDENPDRELAEWLLALIAEAAERGEGATFAQPQTWRGGGEV